VQFVVGDRRVQGSAFADLGAPTARNAWTAIVVRSAPGGQLPGDPPYPTWLSATAQPGAVPGAWLKVADCVVFQPPVHPGGGTNVDGVTVATTAAGAAPTVATAAGSARPSTTVAAATGMRTVGCMVSLLTHRSGNRRCCDAASNLARTCGGVDPGASRRQMPDRFRPTKR
jgi:hypothetical protein